MLDYIDPPSGALAGLEGVRLGQNERTLLMNAPAIGTPLGLRIVAPEATRSAQQGYLRAVKKLCGLQLVHRATAREHERARDPRREVPVYALGRFWWREEQTRIQVVSRIVVWVTPFGEGIRMAYEKELTSRGPIRWTPKKVGRAQRYARESSISTDRQSQARSELRALPDAAEGPWKPRDTSQEAFPAEVDTKEQRRRWRIAVAVARKENPALGSSGLWKAALVVYCGELSDDELLASLGHHRRHGSEPALKFKWLEMAGILISTDPAVRRDQIARGDLESLGLPPE